MNIVTDMATEFTYDECESIQAIIDILDAAHRADGLNVLICTDDAIEMQQVLQIVLDKMLRTG